MKIAYLARCDVSAENGVLKKLVSQVENWRAAGHEAALFIQARESEVWPRAQSTINSVMKETGWLTRGIRLRPLVRAIENWGPNVIYARFDTGSFALAATMNRIPTVLELNTDDISEYRVYLPWYQYLHHRAVRGHTLRRAAGFVAVTEEIANRFRSFGCSIAVIANGIDMRDYAPLAPTTGNCLRLGFMGSPGAAWHGVDKIIEFSRSVPEIHIDLIGPRQSQDLPSNVTAHGMLARDDYELLVTSWDAAIGTLAMHRNGMNEGSTLKVREYLAMGLPCIIGYRDTDFPIPVPFILQLPNTENNAVSSTQLIVDFLKKWHGKRVPRASIRHLDLASKEVERLAFMSRAAVGKFNRAD
jgi:hypothetical protein